jgi:hypothetical protein
MAGVFAEDVVDLFESLYRSIGEVAEVTDRRCNDI